MPDRTYAELKACGACRASKRKCTKAFPTCHRCEQRGLHCVYEARPQLIIYQAQDEHTLVRVPQTYHTEHHDHQIWGLQARSDGHLLDIRHRGRLPSPIAPLSINLDELRSAWFLTPNAMSLVPTDLSVIAPISLPAIQRYIIKTQQWLQEWVATGCNSFVHHELYSKRMPHCVQDAFMALCTYESRNGTSEELVLRLVQEKADRLVQSADAADSGDLVESIGRVQALLIYSVIGLFDGDIRQRYLAEQRLPNLMTWVELLLEQTTHTTASDGVLLCRALIKSVNGSDPSRSASPSSLPLEELLWRAWILSESVRRTWYICKLIANSYRILKSGEVQCSGMMPLTTRSGVWEAKTAHDWMKTCAENNVGFSPRNEYEGLTAMWKVEDVDKFAFAVMELDLGSERIERWRDASD